MKIILTKTNKPRQFSYKPLYYSEENEEKKSREKLKRKEKLSEDELRESIQSNWQISKEKRNKYSSSRLKLLIYVAIIALAIYVYFFVELV